MPTVRQAVASEVPAIARLLSRGFADDPIEQWCLACRGYRAVLELEFLEVAGQIAPEGWLWVTDAPHGVAAWIPPNAGYDDAAVDANDHVSVANSCHRSRTAWIKSIRHHLPVPLQPPHAIVGDRGLMLQSVVERCEHYGRNCEETQ